MNTNIQVTAYDFLSFDEGVMFTKEQLEVLTDGSWVIEPEPFDVNEKIAELRRCMEVAPKWHGHIQYK